jgi:transcriptional regulator with XRE-family HTH domain
MLGINNVPLMKSLGAELRTLRQEQLFTQKSFAAKCGLHPSIIANAERGKRRVTLEDLFVFATGLGMSPTDFTRCVETHYRAQHPNFSHDPSALSLVPPPPPVAPANAPKHPKPGGKPRVYRGVLPPAALLAMRQKAP